MNLKEQVLTYLEQSEYNENDKRQYKKWIKIVTQDMGIDLMTATADEETVFKQKGLLYDLHRDIKKDKVSNLYKVIKLAYEIRWGNALPNEKRLEWKLNDNFYNLADCVVDMVLIENDETLLSKLDGFNEMYEYKDRRLQDLVDKIMRKLSLQKQKRGAIHSQLSIVGAAFNHALSYNKDAQDEYRNYINEKLTDIQSSIQLEIDEVESFEEDLNFNTKVYREGGISEIKIKRRKRNSMARLKVLKRDEFTCQCCGLKPLEIFKNTLHVHHMNPLYKENGVKIVDFNTLITVCPTCHGYIHSRQSEYDIEEIKLLIND